MVGQGWVTKAIISDAIIEYRFVLFLGLKGLLRAFMLIRCSVSPTFAPCVIKSWTSKKRFIEKTG